MAWQHYFARPARARVLPFAGGALAALALCVSARSDQPPAADADAKRIEQAAELVRQLVGLDLAGLASGKRPDQPSAAVPTAAPSSDKKTAPRSEIDDALLDESSQYPQGEPGEEARLKPLSPELEKLRDQVRRVLGTYYERQLNTRDHNPWEMMHAIIAYAGDTQIRRGQPNGARINAVEYLAANGPCHGLQLLYLDRGRVNARKGVYVQGHYGQLLAILGQCRVPLSCELTAGGKKFTLRDLLETEKYTCDDGMELTFKLISFAHYCDSDETWKNFKGDTWSIPRIIRAELAAPILSNAACGGTHRLTGFAYAVRNRKRQGKPIDGEWARAQKYLDDYHRYTLALQNSDGSFSTEWFRRREAKPDLDRRIQTTGHILEWLVYSLPAEQLDHPQVVKAVNYLSGLMLSESSRYWEIGPLGHAVHALAIYDARRFKPFDGGELTGAQAREPSQVTVTDQPQPPAESSRMATIAEPRKLDEPNKTSDPPGELPPAITQDFDVHEYIAPKKTTGSVVPREARRRRPAAAPQQSDSTDASQPLDRRRMMRPFFKPRGGAEMEAGAMPDGIGQPGMRQQRWRQPAFGQQGLGQEYHPRDFGMPGFARPGDPQARMRGSQPFTPVPDPRFAEPTPAPVEAPSHGPLESVAPGLETPAEREPYRPEYQEPAQPPTPAGDGPALLLPQ